MTNHYGQRRPGWHWIAAAGLAAVMLSACGGGGGDSAAVGGLPSVGAGTGGGGTTSTGNLPPVISGSPTAAVMQGTTYSFTPRASDPNNDSLRFSVTGLPPWASFSPVTGRISGNPGSGDVGTYSNIRLSVSDGAMIASLRAFTIEVVATAFGTATLIWQPPTQNTNGTPLVDLAGYKVYWGTDPDDLANSAAISNPGITSYVIEQLTPATWYFAATAFDSMGLESRFTSPASKTITQ